MPTNKQQPDVPPPWAVRTSMNPGDDSHWLTPAGRSWMSQIFLPFYDALTPGEQIAYCNRWNAPTPWITLFLHPDLDEAMAEAEGEHLGEFTTAPLNYRTLFLK